jgi:hypothetical protein
MLKAGFAHAREDFEARRAADLKITIGTMVQATEKNLNAARAGLDKESFLDLQEALERAKAAALGEDANMLQTAYDALDRATMPLAALLMNNVAQKALMGKSLGDL